MVYSNDVWYLVTNTRGVTSFVGTAGRPLPLSSEEVARMGLDKVAVDVDFVVGDDVQVVSGPLESFSGKIISLNDNTQKAMVNVVMFGRATNVELDYVQIKKIKVVTEEEQA